MPDHLTNGGPAFPSEHDGTWNQTYQPGMSLRDWFAGQAISGFCVGLAGLLGGEPAAYATGSCNAVIVARAYALADAAIRARGRSDD